MAFVYKYVDNNDNVVYVGKVKSDDYRGLVRRHKEHLYSDDWCTNNLKMYYFETKSHADADIYETFFISYYKQRYNLFNKAKLWGKSDLDLECSIDWIGYEDGFYPGISEFEYITQSKERLATFIHTITVCCFGKNCERCELNKYGCNWVGIMKYLNKESEEAIENNERDKLAKKYKKIEDFYLSGSWLNGLHTNDFFRADTERKHN